MEGGIRWPHTRSKAVEHALGCVATKMGFDDMAMSGGSKAVLIFQDLPAFLLLDVVVDILNWAEWCLRRNILRR